MLEDIVDDSYSFGDLPCMPLLQLEAKTLVSVFLALGTYWIAMQLKSIRGSEITHRDVRKFLADFGKAPPRLFCLPFLQQVPCMCVHCTHQASAAAL